MPILELDFREVFKGISCGGCISTIEHALYRLGVSHFEFDLIEFTARIVYQDPLTKSDIFDTMHQLNYEPRLHKFIED